MSQLALFDQPQSAKPAWSAKDVWSPAWNTAINLAIVEACRDSWKSLEDLEQIRADFGGLGHTPFAMQVVYVEEHLHRLRVQTHPKTFVRKWKTA